MYNDSTSSGIKVFFQGNCILLQGQHEYNLEKNPLSKAFLCKTCEAIVADKKLSHKGRSCGDPICGPCYRKSLDHRRRVTCHICQAPYTGRAEAELKVSDLTDTLSVLEACCDIPTCPDKTSYPLPGLIRHRQKKHPDYAPAKDAQEEMDLHYQVVKQADYAGSGNLESQANPMNSRRGQRSTNSKSPDLSIEVFQILTYEALMPIAGDDKYSDYVESILTYMLGIQASLKLGMPQMAATSTAFAAISSKYLDTKKIPVSLVVHDFFSACRQLNHEDLAKRLEGMANINELAGKFLDHNPKWLAAKPINMKFDKSYSVGSELPNTRYDRIYEMNNGLPCAGTTASGAAHRSAKSTHQGTSQVVTSMARGFQNTVQISKKGSLIATSDANAKKSERQKPVEEKVASALALFSHYSITSFFSGLGVTHSLIRTTTPVLLVDKDGEHLDKTVRAVQSLIILVMKQNQINNDALPQMIIEAILDSEQQYPDSDKVIAQILKLI